MKTSSAKAKGRRLQQWIAKNISRITGIKHGKDQLIESREMGIRGCDIKLYSTAAEMFPFSVECKNQETWSIPAWIRQAQENQVPGTDWLLVCKRNHCEPVVIMDASAWFDYMEQYIQSVWR